MRRAFLLPLLLTACGLTARGSGAPDGGAIDPSTPDGAPAIDAGIEEDAPPPLPCSVEFDEPFATKGLDPTKWLTTQNVANTGYPQPIVIDRNLVAMLEPTTPDARGGLWYIPRVPFTAFDVDMDVQLTCDSSSCGDGLAVVFLDPTDEVALDTAGAASSLGIPNALNGAAVAIDLAKHAELADGEAPSIGVLEIDASKTPGAYPWTLTFGPPNPDLRNKPHRLALSMRNKQVTVSLDGVQVISGAMPRLPDEGTFGFTAASGSWTARIFLGDVHAKFYRCNAP